MKKVWGIGMPVNPILGYGDRQIFGAHWPVSLDISMNSRLNVRICLKNLIIYSKLTGNVQLPSMYI